MKSIWNDVIFYIYHNSKYGCKISFTTSSDSEERRSGGRFCPNSANIIVTRPYNNGSNTVNYLDEVFIILHEYGHYSLLVEGNEITRGWNYISSSGFDYRTVPIFNLKNRYFRIKEEIFAWIKAFIFLWKIPMQKNIVINTYYRLLLSVLMFIMSLHSLFSYFFVTFILYWGIMFDQNYSGRKLKFLSA